ncbi:hypothetical protein BDN70DRAFT_351076 [Pholiota conissans]|uniref:Uncharacterized protein n=1 Tax=Pholiota conissans TaxID=109636 RepID=A0A9P5Z975_9AGAR|nr:hypothetical protein BDN70DRAFT_351076 [Pholiota conissans]
MCISGKELRSVCMINSTSGIRVYDQQVKPAKRMVEYLTRTLNPVMATYAELQASVLRLLFLPTAHHSSTPKLSGDTVIRHPRCVGDDTLMYHHPRGRPLPKQRLTLADEGAVRFVTKLENGY